MADVSIKVSLDGTQEVKSILEAVSKDLSNLSETWAGGGVVKNLGTLDQGLAKIAARSAENARKIEEATGAQKSNNEETTTAISLREKQILALQRLNDAEAKMAASNKLLAEATKKDPVLPFDSSVSETKRREEARLSSGKDLATAALQSKDFAKSLAEVEKATEPVVTGLGKVAVAGGTMVALGLNTRRAQQELMMLGREAISGNFSHMPMTFTRLVMHTNLWQAALSPIGLLITATAATVGVLTYAFIASTKEMREMNNALTTTGNFAGITRGQMLLLAESVSKAGAMTVGTSKDIVTQIVASGRYGAENISGLAKAIENYSHITGESIDKVTPKLIKQFEDPSKAAEELNKQYHTLSVTELERIRTLDRTGQSHEAVTAAMKVIPDIMPEYLRNIGLAERAWHVFKLGLDQIKEGIKGIGATVPIELQVKGKQEEIDRIINARSQFNKAYDPATDPDIKRLKNEQMLLMDNYVAQQKINKAKTEVTDQAVKEQKAQELVHQTLQYQNKELRDRLTLAANIKDPVERAQTETKLRKEISDNERSQGASSKALQDARIAGEEKLRDIRDRGAIAQIDTELKLGYIQEQEAERRKAIISLEKNYQSQLSTQLQLRNPTLAPEARETLQYKLRQQEVEFQILAAAVGQKEQVAEKLRIDKEAVALLTAGYNQVEANLAAITTLQNKQGNAQKSLNESVRKQLEEEEFKLTLIGKTTAQQQVLTALHKLDLDYLRAGLPLSGEMYEKDRERLRIAVQANADASKDINEFWKTAAKDMQRSMGDFFFDVMQGQLGDLVGSFKKSIDRMVANALAAKAMLELFGPEFGTKGSSAPIGGWIGKGIGMITGMFNGGAGPTLGNFPATDVGFATGGSFTVGGSGGTDSQPVGFKATPGERVTVETPEQQRGSSRPAINFNGPLIAVYAKDVQSFNKSRGQVGAEMYSMASNFARRFS